MTIPVKAIYTSTDVTALGEFVAGETIPVANGGTGATTLDGAGIVQKTSNTGSAILPSGTTAERDGTPEVGYKRFNTTLGKEEVWNGTAWVAGGGATGGSGDECFYLNSQTVDHDFTIPAGKNAMSAGGASGIEIANGVTVTITTGSSWVIV